jgi:hypothetical protein
VREDGRIVGEGWEEKVHNRGMEEAPENGKESSHSTHANRMNEMNIIKMFFPSLQFVGNVNCCWLKYFTSSKISLFHFLY